MDFFRRLEAVVAELADTKEWNWAERPLSRRDAADSVLHLMAKNGLVEHFRHPYGGNVWKVNGKIFGRLDGVRINKKGEIIGGIKQTHKES